MSSSITEECALNYVDKVYSTLATVWTNISYLLAIQIGLSLLVIGTSTNSLPVNEDIALGIFDLKIPPNLFLLCGVTILIVLSNAVCSQILYAHVLRKEIWRRYKTLGLHQPLGNEKRVDPFEPPNVFYSIIMQAIDLNKSSRGSITLLKGILAVLTFLIIVIILPFTAQIVAGIRIAVIYGYGIRVGYFIALLLCTLLVLPLVIFLDEEPYVLGGILRYYWNSKHRRALRIVEEMFELITSIDPQIELEYNLSYISLAKSEDFVRFIRDKDTILMVVRLGQEEDIDNKLFKSGMSPQYDDKDGCYEVKLTSKNLKDHTELLTELLQVSYDRSRG